MADFTAALLTTGALYLKLALCALAALSGGLVASHLIGGTKSRSVIAVYSLAVAISALALPKAISSSTIMFAEHFWEVYLLFAPPAILGSVLGAFFPRPFREINDDSK